MATVKQGATLPAYGFVESTIFTAKVYDYLSDEEYAELQLALAKDPLAGDVIKGTGGLRKVRWADKRRGKGKRGGTRIIYFVIDEDGVIYLLTIFDKDEMTDLNHRECKALKTLVDAEKEARRARRAKGRAR
ncbi:MAG TPA: toxin [Thermoleophilia bacterium]|nr:toxin [Thermoleophilia bacterium]